ncbi:hypothetical protein GCM10022240_00770 [Microbacterium kribbense]|uniref:DUF1697 domain-containing protein n=1 Tax=Microbacterium kribbense TaxID=433645 RepID=A0ABP7FZU6_9MICO
MPTYLAFLRAVNLGATRAFPKDDIRRVAEQAGCTDVQTHINSGNVRLRSPLRSRAKIECALEGAFAADRGFEVPTVVFEASEFAAIARDVDELAVAHPEIVRHYVYLLKDELDAEALAAVAATKSDAGEMVVRARAAHALLGAGYQPGAVDPLNAAKLLGVATSRNATVIRAIAAKWC